MTYSQGASGALPLIERGGLMREDQGMVTVECIDLVGIEGAAAVEMHDVAIAFGRFESADVVYIPVGIAAVEPGGADGLGQVARSFYPGFGGHPFPVVIIVGILLLTFQFEDGDVPFLADLPFFEGGGRELRGKCGLDRPGNVVDAYRLS